MADIRMNQLGIIDDAAYVYAEAANGGQVKIPKNKMNSLCCWGDAKILDTFVGEEIDTGLDGSGLLVVSYPPFLSQAIYAIPYHGNITQIVNAWYHISVRVDTTGTNNRIYITQNTWGSMRLYARFL